MKISRNGKALEFEKPFFDDLLNSLQEFEEFDLQGEDGTNLFILFNAGSALATYYHYEGDLGFVSSIGLEKSSEYEKFILSNGQADEFPKNILISRLDGIKVMFYYIETCKMYPAADWNWISQEHPSI